VSFDPRGVGGSAGIDCGLGLDQVVGGDPTPDTEAERAETADLKRRIAAGCARAAGDILPQVGSVNVARDLNRIREALGDRKPSYLGFSYGTRLGSVYAHLFPGRVRAMVLDGGVPPGGRLVELGREAARAVEDALRRFFADCRGRENCPIGPDPEAVWDRLRERLERTPLTSAGREVTPGHLAVAASLALGSGSLGWEVLASAIAAADGGRGEEILALVDILTWEGDGHTALWFGDDCAGGAVVRYVVELEPPRDGTACPAGG
jgi:pimeloyl-ACP methyl ester carboxylesterase